MPGHWNLFFFLDFIIRSGRTEVQRSGSASFHIRDDRTRGHFVYRRLHTWVSLTFKVIKQTSCRYSDDIYILICWQYVCFVTIPNLFFQAVDVVGNWPYWLKCDHPAVWDVPGHPWGDECLNPGNCGTSDSEQDVWPDCPGGERQRRQHFYHKVSQKLP